MTNEIGPNMREEIDKINKEGFEGNDESGAAILIGKGGEEKGEENREMKRLRERVETEGRAADLETYLRMHKEIAVPKEEIDNLPEEVEKGHYVMHGVYHDTERGHQSYGILFFDKDGNIAHIIIDASKIEGTEEDEEWDREETKTRLEKLGFKKAKGKASDFLHTKSREYEEELERRKKEETATKFDY